MSEFTPYRILLVGRIGDRSVVVGSTIIPKEFQSLALLRWNRHPAGYAKHFGPKKQRIYLHQFVFRLVHGKIPEGKEIDHIDRNPSNNMPDNLRAVTHGTNIVNKAAWGSSGFAGVYWDKTKLDWYARIGVEGRTINLGRFSTLEDAKAARKEAENRYYPR